MPDPADLFDGRYALEGVLGSGGTGTVFLARDRLLDRPVALKQLRGGAATDDVHRARLRAEARLAGAVLHPSIAQVYDFGETPTGPTQEPTPFIVMQYVDGVPLSVVLKERRRLPAPEVMDLVAALASALDAAHERGIVHRDLKPGNILVTPTGRPVLVDFGIARSSDLEPLTLTGTIVGTVDYISPEQTAGRSATPRSDLYSLGMVAYEALTGRRPFRRESQVATALAHLHDELPPLDDDVPSDVAELVLAMLQRDPDDRPESAAVVAARARSLSARGPVTTSSVVIPPPAPPRVARETASPRAFLRPLARSRRTYVGAAVVASAVLVSLFVAARPQPEAAASPRSVPDVEGQRVQAAMTELDRQGVVHVTRRAVDDPAAARGTVLDQDPPAGTRSAADTQVVLDVATGRTTVARDELVGEGYTEAARRLVEAGLVPLRVVRAQTTATGYVVEASPVGRLPIGSIVTLTVAVRP